MCFKSSVALRSKHEHHGHAKAPAVHVEPAVTLWSKQRHLLEPSASKPSDLPPHLTWKPTRKHSDYAMDIYRVLKQSEPLPMSSEEIQRKYDAIPRSFVQTRVNEASRKELESLPATFPAFLAQASASVPAPIVGEEGKPAEEWIDQNNLAELKHIFDQSNEVRSQMIDVMNLNDNINSRSLLGEDAERAVAKIGALHGAVADGNASAVRQFRKDYEDYFANKSRLAHMYLLVRDYEFMMESRTFLQARAAHQSRKEEKILHHVEKLEEELADTNHKLDNLKEWTIEDLMAEHPEWVDKIHEDIVNDRWDPDDEDYLITEKLRKEGKSEEDHH